MPVTFPSLATAKSNILGFFRNQLGTWDLSSKGFIGKIAAVVTLTVYSWLRTARQIDNDATPSDRTSYDGLSEWATNGVGISDGADGYGPRVATAATGGVGTFTGTVGTVYPINSTLTASDGVTKFILTAAVTIPGGGSASGNINATTTGIAGNLVATDVLTVDSVPVGGNSSVTLTTGLEGGTDGEPDTAAGKASLLSRIRNRLRNPPKGGVANDYAVWLTTATTADGVAIPLDAAYIYPRRIGTGTVDAVVTQAGSGTSRDPGSTNATNAQTAIDALRPVAVESVRVLRPYQPAGAGCDVRMRVIPTTGNDFDWNIGGPPPTLTVDTLTDATHIKLNTAAPADLKAALDAGSARVQFVSHNGGYVLPIQVEATSWSDGGGKTTLEIPAGYSASIAVGNEVYAGGPAVETVAANVLDLVDSLGPSRVSGLYDPDQTEWDDTLRVDALIQTAMNAVDDAGGRLVKDLATDPTINGAATNKQADDAGATAPQLLYLKSIGVTP